MITRINDDVSIETYRTKQEFPLYHVAVDYRNRVVELLPGWSTYVTLRAKERELNTTAMLHSCLQREKNDIHNIKRRIASITPSETYVTDQGYISLLPICTYKAGADFGGCSLLLDCKHEIMLWYLYDHVLSRFMLVGNYINNKRICIYGVNSHFIDAWYALTGSVPQPIMQGSTLYEITQRYNLPHTGDTSVK